MTESIRELAKQALVEKKERIDEASKKEQAEKEVLKKNLYDQFCSCIQERFGEDILEFLIKNKRIIYCTSFFAHTIKYSHVIVIGETDGLNDFPDWKNQLILEFKKEHYKIVFKTCHIGSNDWMFQNIKEKTYKDFDSRQELLEIIGEHDS